MALNLLKALLEMLFVDHIPWKLHVPDQWQVERIGVGAPFGVEARRACLRAIRIPRLAKPNPRSCAIASSAELDTSDQF
jgi:hypothetical protein